MSGVLLKHIISSSALSFLLAVVGCTGEIGGSSPEIDVPGPVTEPGEDPIDDGTGPTGCGLEELFSDLQADCVSCHRSGNTPFFGTRTAFYNLLVSNPRWVTPGQPDSSGLVAILEGRGDEPYRQMPVGGLPFRELDAAGETRATMDQVRNFIAGLSSCEVARPAAPPVTHVQRKSAEQIYNSLRTHIGLEDEDIVSRTGAVSEERFPIWNPDDVRRVTDAVNFDVSGSGATRRWLALGGQFYLRGTRPNRTLSPSFGQTIVQVSQAWCRIGVEKPDNTALFRHVAQSNLEAASDADVKENIRYLMLRFWGHVATDEEVEKLFDDIYTAYVSVDHDTAWVAVCSTLVRDPMWIAY